MSKKSSMSRFVASMLLGFFVSGSLSVVYAGNFMAGDGAIGAGKQDSIAIIGKANGSSSIAMGHWAAATDESVSIGPAAGRDSTGSRSIMIGRLAGDNTKSTSSIIMGVQSGGRGSTNDRSVLIGNFANGNNKGSTNADVAIGSSAHALGGWSNSLGNAAYTDSSARAGLSLGSFSKTSVAKGVALGTLSIANVDKGIEGYSNMDRRNSYIGLTGVAKTSTLAAVSVGYSNGELRTRSNYLGEAVDEGTRQIVHVAAGTNDTDAVNVAQLRSINLKVMGDTTDPMGADVRLDDQALMVKGDGVYITTEAKNNDVTIGLTDFVKEKLNSVASNADVKHLESEVRDTRHEMDHLGAQSAALSSLHPLQYDKDKPSQFMVGLGHYKGKSAAAIGLAYYLNDSLLVHSGTTFWGSHVMTNLGMTYKFGSSPSQTDMSKETMDDTSLKQEIMILKEQLKIQQEEIAALKEQQKLFLMNK